jgi:hypothetical protein
MIIPRSSSVLTTWFNQRKDHHIDNELEGVFESMSHSVNIGNRQWYCWGYSKPSQAASGVRGG